jgi:subtilisin family serine protease
MRCGVCALIVVALGILGSRATTGQETATEKPARMSPRDHALFDQGRSQRPGRFTGNEPPSAKQGPARFRVFNVEFDSPESCKGFQADGITIFSQFDKFADVFVPARLDIFGHLTIDSKYEDAIEKAKGYRYAESAAAVFAPPPRVGDEQEGKSRATPEEIVRGGAGGMTGKGVIVAVLDTGIDFRNPDFITYDADGKPTSRLLYFWDSFSDAYGEGKSGRRAPLSYPTGASLGTLYTQDDLTAELRSVRPRIPVWDTGGHGTSCASIAAGNGNNAEGVAHKECMGVAPGADLIGVRLGQAESVEHSYLINAVCGWLDQVAGDRPLVVSCSFGGQHGGRDGWRIEERELDARFPLDKKSRAICIAAGNDGFKPVHAEIRLGSDKAKAKLKWRAGGPAFMEVYYDTKDKSDLRLEGVDKSNINTFLHGLTGMAVSQISLAAGAGELSLFTASGKDVKADAYIEGQGAGFVGCASFGKQVGTPGTASHAITVGSYDWNDQFSLFGRPFTFPVETGNGQAPLEVGALSRYSNPGPSRLGDVVKPEVAAPGQYFSAAAALNTQTLRDSSNHYCLFNGTSAATPYTAGVIALLFEKKPTLTLGEIKDLLRQHCTKDHFTGQVPNPGWGYGKLDLKAVQEMLK